MVDTLGLLLAAAVTAANLDDGTHAKEVLKKLGRDKFPGLEVVYADNKYNDKSLGRWLEKTKAPYRIEVSSKGKDEKGFVPIRICWRVEQGVGCLGRYRRLSKDYEYDISSSETWIRTTAVGRMARRLEPAPADKSPTLGTGKSAEKRPDPGCFLSGCL